MNSWRKWLLKNESGIRMKELEQYFKALADGNRLRILNLLLHGELCGCDIQYVLETSQPNVSRHLAYLKNSGLVIDRRDGFRIFYRLAEPMQGTQKKLFEFLHEAYKHEEQLQQDTARLREAVKEGSCTVSEWKPYSAIGGARGLHGSRT
jgi:ArsR family transcriptional regulator, arsenate/arsenite/antimonite-responsive transcriptional repressor